MTTRFITVSQLSTLMEAGNRNRLSDLLNVEPGVETQSNEALNQFVDQANSIVESYVAQLYPVPMSTVPPILTSIAGRIARYNLIAFVRPEVMTDEIANDYAMSMRELDRIASGVIKLQYPAVSRREEEVAAGNVSIGRGISGTTTTEYDRVLRNF